ncbi:hypothetical protein PILCRDRAFT_823657 [Piloderma croceum F 1598]|uniref:FZ domain-containing protein n=1 Tax=Piloderma croceum (strain F 1598) TaxID=765440 RepID=A0A0C3BPY6_PILCF|nr:hypothetical protein PILCRDRAFT_823657 [Piloderma croceum F 1598]
MLPHALLCLLQAALITAQTRQQLSLNSLSSFSPQSLPNPPAFSLPSSDALAVSVAVCSGDLQSSLPRFFVTNDTSVGIPGSGGGTNVFEIFLDAGLGNWTGLASNGGVLAVENAGQTSFEVGVSNTGPLHQHLNTPPLLGDTTSNGAILFSPPFAPAPNEQPTYPNYTLPLANLTPPTPPSSPNFTLILSPTSSSLAAGLQTGCKLASIQSSGNQISQTPWLRDQDGWRSQWLIGSLTSATNYTAFVIRDSTKVSGPIYLVTKSAAFSCPLVHSLPFCPSVSYAVPLSQPSNANPAYDANTLPSSVTQPLLTYMTNFTTTLLTFACGRDMYSPLQSCADCQTAYRKWLCSVSFTRCSEASPGSASSTSQTTGIPQQPLSALFPQPTNASDRNSNLSGSESPYTTLLPCLETCTAVDRACPSFIGFKCPVVRFNAATSYGVGFIDSGKDGVQGQGSAGTAQDMWGNIWCNGS